MLRTILPLLLLLCASRSAFGHVRELSAGRVEIEGVLRIVMEDHFDTDEHFMNADITADDGSSYAVSLDEGGLASFTPDQLANARVTATIRRSGREAHMPRSRAQSSKLWVVDEMDEIVPSQPGRGRSLRGQSRNRNLLEWGHSTTNMDASNILLVRVSYTNPTRNLDYMSQTQLANLMWNGAVGSRNADRWFQETSYGRLSFPASAPGSEIVDVTIDSPDVTTCDYYGYASAVDAELTAMGYDLNAVNHIGYYLPRWSGDPCGWGGLGQLNGKLTWYQSTSGGTLVHEIGHNLDWHHSSTDPEDDQAINSEYGDRSDLMGSSGCYGTATAPHRYQVDYLAPEAIVHVGAGETMTTTIGTIEYDYGAAGNLQGGSPTPTVLTASSHWNDNADDNSYFVSFRRAVGSNGIGGCSQSNSKLHVHTWDAVQDKPYIVQELSAGGSWTSARTGFSVSFDSQSGDFATVTVTDGSDPCSALTQDFEATTGPFLLYNGADDDTFYKAFSWKRGTSTPSGSTGPSAASSGSSFLYFESSSPPSTRPYGGLTGNEAKLHSVPLAADAGCSVSFDYHMYGSQTGSLRVEQTRCDGSGSTVLASFMGQQQSSATAAWLTSSVTLAARTSGEVALGCNPKLTFVAVYGTGYRGDISLDNVVFGQNCVAACGGCPDADSDGVCDDVDGCPSDPNKSSPGVCGCGELDADSDGDNTADCNDGCPADPSKTAPGVCGCGSADTDSDNDGVLDCNDVCPGFPDDVDTNNNGIPDGCENSNFIPAERMTVTASTGVTSTHSLSGTYTADVVVVCQLAPTSTGTAPHHLHVFDVTRTSFKLRAGRAVPSSATPPAALTDATVYCVAVQEGVYDAADGGKMMAVVTPVSSHAGRGRFTSANYHAQSYATAFSDPVVVGQVMSWEAANPSARSDSQVREFFANNGGRAGRPTSSKLYVGFHIAEDSSAPSGGETLGYLVMENGNTVTAGPPGASFDISAGVTGDNVRHASQSRTVSLPSPAAGVVTACGAGVDGGDGFWPLITDSVSSSFTAWAQEDTIQDTETGHTTEDVTYIAYN